MALAALTGRTPARAASSPLGAGTCFLFVFSDPVEGQEEAYARWFAEPHVRQVGALAGVLAAQHYSDDAGVVLRRSAVKTPRDLVVYTIAADRLDEAKAAIGRQAEGGAWPGPTIASVRTVTYRATQRQMEGAGGEPANAKEGAKSTYLVLAFLDAVAGQDEAFNTWYETVHEPELLSNRGVVSGQRGLRSDVQLGPSDIQSRYLMMMTLVTSDLPAVFHEILGGGPPSPALDRTRGFGFNYKAVVSSA